MAGNNDDTRDLFSQSGILHRPSAMDDFGQASSAYAGVQDPGRVLGGLDLNSQVESYPDLERYQRILQPEEDFGHGLPPIRPGSRSSGIRGRLPQGGSGGASRSKSASSGAGSSRLMRGFIPPGSALGGAGHGRAGGGGIGDPMAYNAHVFGGGGCGFSMPPGAPSSGRGGIRDPMAYGGGIGDPMSYGAGRGFSMPPGASSFGGGGRGRASSSATPVEDVDTMMTSKTKMRMRLMESTFDKANWIEENIFTLCDIACEEARDGNCPNGVWTTRGYLNLKTKFFQRARLRHSSKQIKNKMNQLKKWYVDWVWLGTKTRKGVAENGDYVAPASWWAKRIKENKNAKKFQFGNPEYLDMLIELYQGVAVDGSTAYFPGDEEDEGLVQPAGDEDAAGEGFVQPPGGCFSGDEGFVQLPGGRFSGDDGFENSPMSTSSRKRGTSSCDNSTATSPCKKSKSPVVKLMRGLLTSFQSDCEKSTQLITELVNRKGKSREKSQNIFVEELTRCQQLAIECGAPEESVEYFCATQLFAKPHNRIMFMNMKSKEARLVWLKRWCQQKNMM
ncbi:uncharacterized protein LOC120653863 [Panicum virgatum]|uniref:uncharacterized protein LOC120653863 n=1 Tax=Panicum virgatum TaxID=38727 RepID=UPI0019D666E8|nr:uncharacterized protein LOC120653863 [Panicum virgatum]